MPSILKVKNWYAQSFEVLCIIFDPGSIKELTNFSRPNLSQEVKDLLAKASGNGSGSSPDPNGVYPATKNPALTGHVKKKPTRDLRMSAVIGAK
jgi:hypothetical protein